MSLTAPNAAVVEEAACKGLEKVPIDDDLEKFFQVRVQLPLQEKLELVTFFRKNVDVFAWDAYEAPRVDPSFICHYLNINPAIVPRRQPPRRSSKEHSKAVKEEVLKLKKAGAIKEVFYPEWLAYTVVVKKKNGKSVGGCDNGHPQMSFLDAFQGYHQLSLALDDQEKTAFVIPTGNYHYKTLRKYQLRLNTSKCSFGVGSGKFLGYMVTHWGIEVNLAQVKAINNLQPPWNPKEVQRLTGMIATLNRFSSWSANSLVLIWVDNNVQRPIYYVRKFLHEVEVHYLPLEKVVLVVVHATQPSLEENVKGLAINEKSVGMISCKEPLVWRVYVDGAANQRGSGVGLVLVSPKEFTFEKSLRLGFSTTSNEAEYEALLVGMDMVQKMGGKTVQMFSDSQPVVGYVEGKLEARDPRMQEYLARVKYLQSKFESFTLVHVSRSMNTHADSLATLATSSAQSLPQVILVEDLCKPSRMHYDIIRVHQIWVGPSWMDPIVSFLKNDVLLEEKSEANKGYDSHVKLRPLAPGDLVLRKVLGTAKNPTWGKLGPNWEGPYRITLVAGIGAYYLADLDGKVVPRP
ncbi:uncharacterized protein LOC142606361 [Castanea sativa]|uniref:uncharacterized protein LOC142606361 n=1 Tax=Castanea sativa TaxID=21020 RepID=UPI003F65176C